MNGCKEICDEPSRAKPGHPPLEPHVVELIVATWRRTGSFRRAAETWGVSIPTVMKYARMAGQS